MRAAVSCLLQVHAHVSARTHAYMCGRVLVKVYNNKTCSECCHFAHVSGRPDIISSHFLVLFSHFHLCNVVVRCDLSFVYVPGFQSSVPLAECPYFSCTIYGQLSL